MLSTKLWIVKNLKIATPGSCVRVYALWKIHHEAVFKLGKKKNLNTVGRKERCSNGVEGHGHQGHN